MGAGPAGIGGYDVLTEMANMKDSEFINTLVRMRLRAWRDQFVVEWYREPVAREESEQEKAEREEKEQNEVSLVATS